MLRSKNAAYEGIMRFVMVDRPRTALHAFFSRRDKPQQQYQKRLIDKDLQATFSPELREVLALDDPLNDDVTANADRKTGFLKD